MSGFNLPKFHRQSRRTPKEEEQEEICFFLRYFSNRRTGHFRTIVYFNRHGQVTPRVLHPRCCPLGPLSISGLETLNSALAC